MREILANQGAPATRVRYAMIALIFVVTTINYADRATFSLAGQAAAVELGLGPAQIGYVLSAFAWAYVLAQLPGGLLLDRWGTKRVYSVAILLWSGLTAFQGFAGLIAGASGLTILLVTRFLVGCAEAPSFPGNARLIAAWFPASERGTASAIFNSGQYFALVLFAPLMGWLAHTAGWRSIFWVMGGLGILAGLIFIIFVHGPVQHPGVNQAELALIEAGGGQIRMEERTQPRAAVTRKDWQRLLCNRLMVGICLGQYCINVLTYFFVTWFPLYLIQARGMNVLEAGLATALPAICGFIGGLAGGFVSDAILRRTGSHDLARKAPLTMGMLLAVLIIGCVWVRQDWLVITLMSVAFFGKGLASLGWAVVADVAPRDLAGLSGSVFNMCGNIAGIVTPMVVGQIVAATGSFDLALVFVGAHCVMTIIAFVVVAGPIRRIASAE
jgi:ACS family glucarate transporter-like MFS transporter